MPKKYVFCYNFVLLLLFFASNLCFCWRSHVGSLFTSEELINIKPRMVRDVFGTFAKHAGLASRTLISGHNMAALTALAALTHARDFQTSVLTNGRGGP